MNKLLRFVTLMVSLICFVGNANGTWYSWCYGKVKTSDSSKGLVYIQAGTESTGDSPSFPKTTPSESDYTDEMDASYQKTKSNGSSSSGGNFTHFFKLYAMPVDDNYKFDHWEVSNQPGITVSTDPIYQASYTHSTSTQDKNSTAGISRSWTAFFSPKCDVIKETNIPAGDITLEPEAPMKGDNVTASIVTKYIYSQNGNLAYSRNTNTTVEFDHWEKWVDGKMVENLGSDPIINFNVEEPMTLKAVYKELGEIPRPGKYYRVRNAYNRVLTVEGGYKKPISGITEIENALLRWALPLDHDYDKFTTGQNNNECEISDNYYPIDPESHPGTIFFIESGNLDDNTNPTEISDAVLASQGVNTNTLTGYKFNVDKMSDQYPGYYGVNAKAVGYAGLQTYIRNNEGVVYLAGFQSNNINCALAIQPIDENHLDYFWFGANAEEEMYFEDGYWTTMYAAFPYELYDDGVEAYYITTEKTTANGITYLYLNKIEDRIVPAKQAVLLKCAKPLDTKSNRMLPLNPSDERLAGKELKGNILKGEYQLYTTAKKEGRVNFDSSTMRVLGVNNDGIVGFYKLSEGTELKANKAYLDMSELPQEAGTSSFRLAPKDFTTGIESIVEDGSSIRIEDNTVYDLMGNRVSLPQPGSIYIINGKKVLWR